MSITIFLTKALFTNKYHDTCQTLKRAFFGQSNTINLSQKTSHEQEQIILYSVLSMHLFIIFFYEVQHIFFATLM